MLANGLQHDRKFGNLQILNAEQLFGKVLKTPVKQATPTATR